MAAGGEKNSHEGVYDMPNHWHPNGAGVSIETQDGTLDLSDVSWQAVAPCGCVSGVTMAAVADELIVTPAQAAQAFAETPAELKQDAERGFTHRAREHRAAVEDMQSKCPHDPTWGYAKPPEPEGYQWAAVHAHGSRPTLTHLVPDAAIKAAKDGDYSVLDVKPLCGGKPAFHWHSEWYATSGKVECKRCVAVATKAEAGAA